MFFVGGGILRKDRIIITKDLIPYTFNILLADELFNLTVQYNETHDIFTIKLEKEGETLCEGEPIIYGFPLFGDLYQAGKFPALRWTWVFRPAHCKLVYTIIICRKTNLYNKFLFLFFQLVIIRFIPICCTSTNLSLINNLHNSHS